MVKKKLTIKTPKGRKEKMSKRKPAPTDHHKALLEPPNTNAKTKIISNMFALLKKDGKPPIKETCKMTMAIINNMFNKILVYIWCI